MEKKTFQEVVRDIKKGEVWTTHEMFDIETVSLTDNGQLVITRRFNERTDGLYIPTTKVFVLRKQIYPFNEAWKSLQEGKEIQSVRSKLKYKKVKDAYSVGHKDFWVEEESIMMNIKDMEEGWYVYE